MNVVKSTDFLYDIFTMKSTSYNVVFTPEAQGGYTAVVPALPGCVTYGKDLLEAKRMAKDAISAYLISLAKHGDSIPTEDQSFLTTVQVDMPGKFVRKFEYA